MPYQENNRFNSRKPLCVMLSAATLIIGIILLVYGVKHIQQYEKTESKELAVDYTNCRDTRYGQNEVRCIDYYLSEHVCVCQHQFEVKEPLLGDVILYYELDSGLQTRDSYIKSRDNLQLSGQMSKEPAVQCEPYRFDESGKPIAPCGEIADSMFTDKYLVRRAYEDHMNVTFNGMIKDKENYRNPRGGNQSLENLFKDFAKPKSWTHNIWELDPDNIENNGFENERFIGWMDTSMKRKPAWRLDPSNGGIQSGTHVLRVEYSYPPSKYNGTRKAVFVASRTFIDSSSYNSGVAMIIFGVIFIMISFAIVGYLAVTDLRRRKEDSEESQRNDGLRWLTD